MCPVHGILVTGQSLDFLYHLLKENVWLCEWVLDFRQSLTSKNRVLTEQMFIFVFMLVCSIINQPPKICGVYDHASNSLNV